jgi:hypothetical protein
MTLGNFAPAMAALAGLLVVLRAVAALRRLPAPGRFGWDPARHALERRAIALALGAAVAAPALLWLMLNQLSPAGAMVLF